MASADDARLTALVAEVDEGTRTVFRDVLRSALQELIETELTAEIGAALHQRTVDRTNQRNGHRPRVLSTPAGDVQLAIAKVGSGRSSRRCWSRAAVWTRRCGRW